jgi:lipid-A-disaccharide synthase
VTGGEGAQARILTVGIIAGEPSGDQLGARLMRALAEEAGRPVRFVGVGGPLMTDAGLDSLFPMSDIGVNGIWPVLRRLPLLLKRMDETARGIAAAGPDVVVHIDAQDFNRRVASKLRDLRSETPLIAYVSPSVWAWRAGRARKIAKLYKHLLAVFPFEPEVHRKLGGPPTTYVGHPLVERLAELTPDAAEQARRDAVPCRLLMLPGSRPGEISRHLPRFGDAAALLAENFPGLEIVIPAVPHLRQAIEEQVAAWSVRPQLVEGEAAKLAAFRTARAAIASSGTVTLELGLAAVPTVTTYRVSWFETELGKLVITAPYASLPSLILGRKLLPEFLDRAWTGRTIADAVAPLLADGPERQAQLHGFAEVRRLMEEGIDSPSRAAARIVLQHVR